MAEEKHQEMSDAKIENIIGALSLALADDLLRAAQHHVPMVTSAPAAAISLVSHIPGITIEQLSRVLKLSHPGTVRLVDRLVDAELLIRTRSQTDGRAVALILTPTGEELTQRILVSRRSVLSRALNSLPTADREMLARIAESMLRNMVTGEDHALEVCRLCDPAACEDCPVTAEIISRST